MNAFTNLEPAVADQIPEGDARVDRPEPLFSISGISKKRADPGEVSKDVPHRSRMPRYLVTGLLGLLLIWAPIIAYLQYAPLRYTSKVSLILPGTGSVASVNLSGIGQASSAAASPFAGSSVSPTATYKRLLGANRVVSDATVRAGFEPAGFGEPRIKLVDETSLILIELAGETPEIAQAKSAALLESFLDELTRLRADEAGRREESARSAIAGYEVEVSRIRDQITDLQMESGLVSVDHYDDLVAGAEALESKVQDRKASMRQLARQVEALHAALGIDALTASLTLRLQADTEYQMLADTMGKYSSELATARGKYGEKHPDLIAARDAYRGAKARLYQRAIDVTGFTRDEIDRWIDMSPAGQRGRLLAELVTKTAARDGMSAEHASLTASLAEHQRRVRDLVAATAKLDDLNRDYQIAEAVFSSALARTDTGKADIYASYPLVQVLEDPSLPTEPSSPKRLLAVAAGIGGCLCLVIALLLAWVRRPMINRLLNRPEVA